jgi:tetratricopeptide (TPR) repeat protein
LGAIGVGLIGAVGTVNARESRLDQPAPFHFPVESSRAIAQHGGQGSIFCADHHGGYLIWTLYPRFRPFADTRWILRTPQEFSDYLTLADDPNRFDELQQSQAFAYVVLPVAYPDRYLGLIAHLYKSAAWRLVGTDGSEVLFARRDLSDGAWDLGAAATTDHVLERLTQRFAAQRLRDAARVQLATLQLAVGETRQARRVLGSMTSPEARALLGRALLLEDDLEGAERLAEHALRRRPSDVHSLALLAQVAIRRGQLQQAAGRLSQALTIDPFDAEALALLSNLEERAHEP